MEDRVKRPAKEGLAEVCRHYLGAPLREESGRLVYACPSCGGATFAANLVTEKAGCWTGRCPPGRYSDIPGLVAHFDGVLSPAEALERAEAISEVRDAEARLPKGEQVAADLTANDVADRCPERDLGAGDAPGGEQVPSSARPTSEGEPGVEGSTAAAETGFARSSEKKRESHFEDVREGWYAVLAAPGSVRPGPKIYRPAGALQPLPASLVTGTELLMTLVVFAVGTACAWWLGGYVEPLLYSTGVAEAFTAALRHKRLCALSVGFLASLAVWLASSSRRHAVRRHLGEATHAKRPLKAASARPAARRRRLHERR